MFLVGGTIKAGLHAAHPSLTDLDQGDLKHHTDFRSILHHAPRRLARLGR